MSGAARCHRSAAIDNAANVSGFVDGYGARSNLSIGRRGRKLRESSRAPLRHPAHVSARIHALEGYLGCQLFVRNKGGTTLTPAGRQFQKHATSLMRTMEQARQDVGVPHGYRGSLTIGGRIGIWESLLLGSRAKFERPPWTLPCTPRSAWRKVSCWGSSTGRIDIVVTYTPQSRPALNVEILLQEKLALVLTDPTDAGYPGPNSIPLNLEGPAPRSECCVPRR